MKILFISNLYPPFTLGGYEILCHQVVERLASRGHQVHILTSDHGVDQQSRSETGGEGDSANIERRLKLIRPFNQPGRPDRQRRVVVGRENYEKTRAAIAAYRPDIIFIWSLLRLSVGSARAAQDSGIPVAYTFNDENISGYLPAAFEARPRAMMAGVLDRALLSKTTLQGIDFRHSTCISQRLKKNLLERGVAAQNTEVIYQGVPIERFPLKSCPGSLHSPLRVLYAGQLHHYKGVHTLLGAAKRVAPQLPMVVTIAGEGPTDYRARLEDMASEVAAEVRFVGRVPHDEMPALYREQDVLIFPSIWPEPFGLTHLEAMASGTPVISTADGGHGEFLRDNENALIFPKEDEMALANCLQRMAGESGLAERLAHVGRRTVEREFSLEGYVSRLEDFLKRSLSAT